MLFLSLNFEAYSRSVSLKFLLDFSTFKFLFLSFLQQKFLFSTFQIVHSD